MKLNRIATALPGVFAFLIFCMAMAAMPALAIPTPTPTDVDQGANTLNKIKFDFLLRNELARPFAETGFGGNDSVEKQKSQGPGSVHHNLSGPVQTWPFPIPDAVSTVPTKRDQGITSNLLKTFGYPVSDTQMQMIGRMNDNIKMEQESDPERTMWQSQAQSAMQASGAANSAAGMASNQGQTAIQFQEKFLKNFTSEAGNRWLVIRDRLFIPIAVLLLLPGAVLCQVKAIVSQSSNVLGEMSPFEGIFRSIIAIFMIPGTLLVINYGIDVSNSVHFTIADEYTRIFGTDMYHDAQCALWRAFPVNAAQSNQNAIQPGSPGTTPPQGNSVFSAFEALDLDVRQYDPCAGLDNSLVPDEAQNSDKLVSRIAMNGTNVALTSSWNILCAFQEAFLFYLFCMGPIAAALWVWPVKGLRSALPSWVEGVIILCFWSLFWNTVVLLMACFRGVSETGTIIMTALNFLSTIVTQYAFDFVGLVTSGASSGVSQAMQQAASSASQNMGGGKGGGAQGGAQGGAAGSHHGQSAHAHANKAAKGASGTAGDRTAAGAPALSSTVAGANGSRTGAGAARGLKDPTHPNGPPVAGSVDSTTGAPAKPLMTQASTDHPLPPGALGPDGKPLAGSPNGPNGPLPPIGAAGPGPAGSTGLAVNDKGALSIAGAKEGQQLTPEQKSQLAGQLQAIQNHDADKLKQMSGMAGNPDALGSLAQNGQLTDAQGHPLSSAAISANIGANGEKLSVGANGQLLGADGQPISVGGMSGLAAGQSMDIGHGSAPLIADSVALAPGQNFGSSLTADNLSHLKDATGVPVDHMQALVSANGTDVVNRDNGQVLASAHDGNLYAPGTNGNVVMGANGWEAASTGTPLSHEGQNWHVANSQIGFDAANGNFSVPGANGTSQLMTGTEFAKQAASEGIVAHMPTNEPTLNKPEIPANVPAGIDQAKAFGVDGVTAGSPAQGLTELAKMEGAPNGAYSYATQGNQLYADANGHHIAHFDSSQQAWVATNAAGQDTGAVLNHSGHFADAGGQTATLASLGYSGGAVSSDNYGGAGYSQASVSSTPIAGLDAVQSQAFQTLARDEGLSNAHVTSDGLHVVGTDAQGHQHMMASESNGQWVASSHGGTADVVMNSQGQWTAPNSTTALTAHENGSSGAVTWSAQAAPEVAYNPQTHMMEAGGYQAPASAVTPDMVANIHSHQSPEILATAGNAGQQLQSLATQEGNYGAVHTGYAAGDTQHQHLQAYGDSNQVVANYNNEAHRWEAAGSGGQVVQNTAGDWVANNSVVNQMAGGPTHVQADGQGHFQAVGSNNQVVATTDASGSWTSPQAQHIADQMGAGHVTLSRDAQGHVDAVTASGNVVATYDTGGSGAAAHPGVWQAGDSSVQNIANHAPVQVQNDGHGHVQAVSNGQVVANYDSAAGGWAPAQANAGVQHLADQMHAGPVHVANNVTPDGQHVFQAVAQNGTVVASYDAAAQHWQSAGGNVVQDNNQNWVANNQYVNTAQETPVQYSPQASYSSGAGSTTPDSSTANWSAAGAPEISYTQGTFSTNYGDGSSPALSMPANNMTPDMVSYVHQNPQQVEGLQHLAHQEQLSGPVQIQTDAAGQVQAVADGHSVAHYNQTQGEWVADNNHHVVERNDGQWVTADNSHQPVELQHDTWKPQAEPQIHNVPPTSSHPNPTIASATGFGAGATALGAWGAMRNQSKQAQQGPAPTPPAPSQPAALEGRAQDTSLDPAAARQRESDEKKRKKLAEQLKAHGEFQNPDQS